MRLVGRCAQAEAHPSLYFWGASAVQGGKCPSLRWPFFEPTPSCTERSKRMEPDWSNKLKQRECGCGRVANGGVTRSARAEDAASRRYEERRVKVAEEVAHKFEGVQCSGSKRKHGEGARLAAALEGSADPEGFFAEMKEEHQRALLLHREREQEWRRGVVEAAMKEALEAEGLGPRDVCPLLRIRVAPLLSPQMQRKVAEGGQRQVEGMISIWRPSEEQVRAHRGVAPTAAATVLVASLWFQMEEVERGGMFLVSALQPTLHSTSTLLSFNTTRSTRWRRISEQAGRQLRYAGVRCTVHAGGHEVRRMECHLL